MDRRRTSASSFGATLFLCCASTACGRETVVLPGAAQDAAPAEVGVDAPTVAIDVTGRAPASSELETHGTALWMRQGQPGNVWPMRLAVASDGTVAITGYFEWGPLHFDTEPPISGKSYDPDPSYIIVLETDGRVRWSRALEYTSILAMSFDASGHLWVGGAFRDKSDFGGGTVSGPAGNVDRDAVLIEYDRAGAFVRSTEFGREVPGSTRWSAIESIAFDGDGHLVVSGHVAGAVDLGGTIVEHAAAPASDGTPSSFAFFLASLEKADLHARWARELDGVGIIEERVAVARDGTIVIAGVASAGADLGLGPLPSNGAFFLELQADGTTAWSTVWPWTPSSLQVLEPVDVAWRADGSVVAIVFGDPTPLGAAPLGDGSDTTSSWVRLDSRGALVSVRPFVHGERAVAFVMKDDDTSVVADVRHEPVADSSSTPDVVARLTALNADGVVSWRRETNTGPVGARWLRLAADPAGFLLGLGVIDRPARFDLGNGLVVTTETTDTFVAKLLP